MLTLYNIQYIQKGFGITAAASQHFNVYGHGSLITMVFLKRRSVITIICYCIVKLLIIDQLCNNHPKT